MRRMAAEKINSMFNLNIEVNFRQSTQSIIDLDDPLKQMLLKDPDTLSEQFMAKGDIINE